MGSISFRHAEYIIRCLRQCWLRLQYLRVQARVAITIFHRRSEEYADARPRHLVPTSYETISIRMKRYYEKKLIQITNPVRENPKICELEIPGRAPIGRDVCSVYNWNVFLHYNTKPFQGGNAFKENPKKETTMATKNQTQFGRTSFFCLQGIQYLQSAWRVQNLWTTIKENIKQNQTNNTKERVSSMLGTKHTICAKHCVLVNWIESEWPISDDRNRLPHKKKCAFVRR